MSRPLSSLRRGGALGVAALVLSVSATAQQQINFLGPRTFPTGGIPADMAVADFDGDGHLDVVITNSGQGTISVLLGTGTGDFQALDDMPSALSPTQIAVGNFDSDPALDLVITETESDSVTFMPGDGHGAFGPRVGLDSGHDSQGVVAADMNGDHKLDAVVTFASEGGGSVNVLLGNGDGTFTYDPARSRAPSRGPGFCGRGCWAATAPRW